jgi:hypothetical protein
VAAHTFQHYVTNQTTSQNAEALTPTEIARRLGADSTSHALDQESLNGLYAAHGQHPSVQLKRRLWARLLTTALGAQFEDSDELFVATFLQVKTANWTRGRNVVIIGARPERSTESSDSS